MIRTIIVHPGGKQVQVSEWIFRSWTGRRFIDGIEYFGPVYNLGTDTIARTNA